MYLGIDWTSQGVSGRQKPVDLLSDTLTVVGKGIRIPAFMTFEPITGSVEDLSTALGRHLHLRPGITAEFSTLDGRRDFELGNRVDIDPICKLLVHSRIRHGLPIDCEVVLIGALPIDVRIHAKARWSSIGRNTWHKLQKTGEVAAIEGDVDHLPTCHDAGPLRRYRFQRDGVASTVTDSVCDPTSRTIGGRPILSFTKSFTSVFLYVLKPGSSTVTVYVAAGRALKR